MASNLDVSPQQAFFAARSADQWNKKNRIIPRKQFDPPGTGSFARFIHEVGYVIDLFLDACQTDPFMLAVSAVPALLEAFYSIIEPDPKELYHEVFGQSLVCSLKQSIQDAHEIERTFWNGATKTLFRIAEVADLAVWRLFLASVLAEGLQEWQSMAQELSGCGDDKSPFSSTKAQGGMPDVDHIINANGLEWLTGNAHFPAFTPDIVLNPGVKGYIIWACEAQNSAEDQVPLVHWIEQSGGGIVQGPEMSIPKAGGGWHSNIGHFRTRNVGVEATTYKLKAYCPIPQPHGEVFFKSGYCATSGI